MFFPENFAANFSIIMSNSNMFQCKDGTLVINAAN